MRLFIDLNVYIFFIMIMIFIGLALFFVGLNK